MGKVSMAVDFAGIKLKNPINTAAGTFGQGWQFTNFMDVSDHHEGLCGAAVAWQSQASHD